MVISSIPSTALAASCPRTSSRIPPRGIGIIMTPAGFRSRSRLSISIPRAWRRINSSRVRPVPKRSVREQSPPIERAAISITQGPASFTLSSAWMGPSLNPRALAAHAVRSATAVWV